MSAYANLPGTSLPRFAFGSLDSVALSRDVNTAFNAIVLPSGSSDQKDTPSYASYGPSEKIVAILSAWVDPVELVKSLSSKRSNNNSDPSAIEFELSITYQGRKYNSTKAFSTFVKLRNDLSDEYEFNSDDGYVVGFVPELPKVSHKICSHAAFALAGVANNISGFAFLQATAKLYVPEMERWLLQVVNAFPYSQSLTKFLWEPLGTSSRFLFPYLVSIEESESSEDEEDLDDDRENAVVDDRLIIY